MPGARCQSARVPECQSARAPARAPVHRALWHVGTAQYIPEISIDFPRRDVLDVVVPLFTLGGHEMLEQVVAKRFPHQVVLLQLVERFAQIPRQLVDPQMSPLAVAHLVDVLVDRAVRDRPSSRCRPAPRAASRPARDTDCTTDPACAARCACRCRASPARARAGCGSSRTTRSRSAPRSPARAACTSSPADW